MNKLKSIFKLYKVRIISAVAAVAIVGGATGGVLHYHHHQDGSISKDPNTSSNIDNNMDNNEISNPVESNFIIEPSQEVTETPNVVDADPTPSVSEIPSAPVETPNKEDNKVIQNGPGQNVNPTKPTETAKPEPSKPVETGVPIETPNPRPSDPTVKPSDPTVKPSDPVVTPSPRPTGPVNPPVPGHTHNYGAAVITYDVGTGTHTQISTRTCSICGDKSVTRSQHPTKIISSNTSVTAEGHTTTINYGCDTCTYSDSKTTTVKHSYTIPETDVNGVLQDYKCDINGCTYTKAHTHTTTSSVEYVNDGASGHHTEETLSCSNNDCSYTNTIVGTTTTHSLIDATDSEGNAIKKCTRCNYTETESHTHNYTEFDHSDKDNEYWRCPDDGVTTTKSHSYTLTSSTPTTSISSTEHNVENNYECSCGQTKTASGTAGHSFTTTTDSNYTAVTGGHTKITHYSCSCGYHYDEPGNTENHITEIGEGKNSTSHWTYVYCTVCNAELSRNESNHTYGTPEMYDEDDEFEYYEEVCTGCGYPHDYEVPKAGRSSLGYDNKSYSLSSITVGSFESDYTSNKVKKLVLK